MDSLSEEFRIGTSTLHRFDRKFLKWFHMTYWNEYVVGETGVGFDDYVSMQREEKLFRQFGLPGFLTCMDGVHLVWELPPFMSSWQYKVVGADEVCKMDRGSPFKNVVMTVTNRKASSTQ